MTQTLQRLPQIEETAGWRADKMAVRKVGKFVLLVADLFPCV